MIGRRAGRLVIAVAALAVLAVLPVGASASAGPLPPAEDDFVARLHSERAAAGLAGYSTAADVVADLVAVARAHAQDMADQNRLHHNPRLPDQVENWDSLGENVGKGAGVDDIHRAFMDSPSHRAEILSTRFTQVGVGVVERDGVLWVVQIFRKPSAAPAAAPAPVATQAAAATPAAAAARDTRSPTTNARPMATAAPTVTITTTAPAGEPLQAAAEAEIGGAPVTIAAAGGGGAGPSASSISRAMAPREATVPIALATALLALMTAASVAEVAAEQRTAGRRLAYLESA